MYRVARHVVCSYDGVASVSKATSHQINQFSPYHRVDKTWFLDFVRRTRL